MKNYNTNFKQIDLEETIKDETLINEKIAPGIKGEFEIIIRTNKDTQYNVKFISKNEKPQNLEFNIKNRKEKVRNLEELEKELTGIIKKNKEEKITIEWEWKYENSKENNIKDTEDAKKIKKYQFEIQAIGEEII